MRLRIRLDQMQRQPRRNHKRNRERDQHADRRIDRNRAHVRPHQPRHERHRQQGRNHRKRRQYRRAADFVDRARDDGCQSIVVKRHAAVDIFYHHNRIVDQNANRKNQREQRHAVQRKSICPRRKQRCGEREDHRAADDQRLAFAECKQHQQHDRRRRKQQLLD